MPIRMNSAEHRDHHPHRQPHVRRGAAAGGELAVVRHHHEIGDAGRDADHGRNEERAAPADPCGQRRGDAGGERHADIAADAVEGERAAAVGRGRDHDRGADRMIDRGEHAEREQRDRERDEVRRQRRGGAAQPAADVEHHHHVAAAPAVGEPAGRQREDAEGEERRGAERQQLAVGAAVDDLEADHHGREDQHHVVIDRVGEVVEADRQTPADSSSRVCAVGRPCCLESAGCPGYSSPVPAMASHIAGGSPNPAPCYAMPACCAQPRAHLSSGALAAHYAYDRALRVSSRCFCREYACLQARRAWADQPIVAGCLARLRLLSRQAFQDQARFLLFATTDLWRQGGFAHGGVLWAPGRRSTARPVLKLMFGGGVYHYRSGALGNADVRGAAACRRDLPGWRFVRGGFTVTVFLGLRFPAASADAGRSVRRAARRLFRRCAWASNSGVNPPRRR